MNLSRATWFVVVFMLGASHVAIVSSQTQREREIEEGIRAYQSGDFARAVATLKPLVYDVATMPRPSDPEPWPTYVMARMAERGEGVDRDNALACALYNLANTSFVMRSDLEHAGPSEEGRARACDRVEDGKEVDRLRAFWLLDGVTSTTWDLGAGGWVTLNRTGFHVTRGDRRGEFPLVLGVVATRLMRHAEVVGGNGASRHFIELFDWVSRKVDDDVQRDLHWDVFEIDDVSVSLKLSQILLVTKGDPYPPADLPVGIADSVSLHINADGEVEWATEGAEGQRGLLPR